MQQTRSCQRSKWTVRCWDTITFSLKQTQYSYNYLKLWSVLNSFGFSLFYLGVHLLSLRLCELNNLQTLYCVTLSSETVQRRLQSLRSRVAPRKKKKQQKFICLLWCWRRICFCSNHTLNCSSPSFVRWASKRPNATRDAWPRLMSGSLHRRVFSLSVWFPIRSLRGADFI